MPQQTATQNSRRPLATKADIAIVVITLLVLATSVVANYLMWQQARLDQRAWVGFTEASVQFSNEGTDGAADAKVTATYLNSGKTPARKVVMLAFIHELPPGQMPDFNYAAPQNSPSGIIQPGMRTQMITSRRVQKFHIFANNLTLFYYGTVWYKDIFDREHRTDFCNQFVPEKGGFAPCPYHEEAN